MKRWFFLGFFKIFLGFFWIFFFFMKRTMSELTSPCQTPFAPVCIVIGLHVTFATVLRRRTVRVLTRQSRVIVASVHQNRLFALKFFLIWTLKQKIFFFCFFSHLTFDHFIIATDQFVLHSLKFGKNNHNQRNLKKNSLKKVQNMQIWLIVRH